MTVVTRSVGSNPTRSAIKFKPPLGGFNFIVNVCHEAIYVSAVPTAFLITWILRYTQNDHPSPKAMGGRQKTHAFYSPPPPCGSPSPGITHEILQFRGARLGRNTRPRIALNKCLRSATPPQGWGWKSSHIPLQVSPTKHKCVSRGPMRGELIRQYKNRHMRKMKHDKIVKNCKK